MKKGNRRKGTHPVKFRLASQRWLQEDWFGHREGTDREVLDLMANDIIRQVDLYRMRNWAIQSSVDNGKTWQLQQNVHIAW